MCDFCSCQLFVGSEVSDLAMYQCNWRPSIYRLWFSLGPLKNRISESISDGADGIKSRPVLPFAVILYLATYQPIDDTLNLNFKLKPLGIYHPLTTIQLRRQFTLLMLY